MYRRGLARAVRLMSSSRRAAGAPRAALPAAPSRRAAAASRRTAGVQRAAAARMAVMATATSLFDTFGADLLVNAWEDDDGT